MLFPALQPIQPSRRDRCDSCRVTSPETGEGWADCCRALELHGCEQMPRCFDVSWGQQALTPGPGLRSSPPPFCRTETISALLVVRPTRRESRPHCLVLAHANVVWGTNPANQSLEKQFKGTLSLRPSGSARAWDRQGPWSIRCWGSTWAQLGQPFLTQFHLRILVPSVGCRCDAKDSGISQMGSWERAFSASCCKKNSYRPYLGAWERSFRKPNGTREVRASVCVNFESKTELQ
ncbi:hypothetical protein B0I37DRAFT_23045 [Chaetomium sp. MPI-CAGE-AT-0009]|nr:hypothetical protein B0I37DRAFT_23045 [Chaetomium sp. MPI-CAGE-AT-0009]